MKQSIAHVALVVRDYERMLARGVTLVREPKHQRYGRSLSSRTGTGTFGIWWSGASNRTAPQRESLSAIPATLVTNIRLVAMRFVNVFGVTLILASIGCASEHGLVDVEAEREALLETARAWAAAAAVGDVERLTSFWADDATNFFPGAPVARGKEAIGELVRRNRSQPGFSLSWEPREAVVARSGELGYTSGTFVLSIENENASVVRRGNYVCIWRKQPDGSWKCAVESTIFGPSTE